MAANPRLTNKTVAPFFNPPRICLIGADAGHMARPHIQPSFLRPKIGFIRQTQHSRYHGGDDIGYWNISAYNRGMMGSRTPNIDRIADEGGIFTDYYGQQSCTAGRAAFIAGQSPMRTGLLKVGLLAFYYALVLRLIGLNHAILIGLAAGLISFIPYLGSLTGLVVSLFVLILQFWPSWTLIPVVLAVFVVGQEISDYVLAPFLIAERVHLNPVEVMFAIAAFGYLFGFVGLPIAVPLAAAIGVVFRFATKQLAIFSDAGAGSEPALPMPPASLLPRARTG
jgi:hypothetical protein